MGENTNYLSTIKEQVYTIIKKNILDGIYKHGTRLLENKIAEELNVSKSPIREALKELSGEGLVEIIPNKGAFVKQLTKQDIMDILEFRIIIEKYSIRKTIEKASSNSLKKLESLYNKMEEAYLEKDVNKYALVDAQFHETIYVLSGNKLIHKVSSNIFYLFQPFCVLSLNSKKRFDSSIHEHKIVLDSILKRDFNRAWKTARKHLELANIEVIKSLNKELVD